MSILVVGSVALDSVETPFGSADRVIGGSGVFFSAAASLLGPVRLVGVVGDDYPMEQLDFLTERGVDLAGVERAEGESFFWAGRYSHDLNLRDSSRPASACSVTSHHRSRMSIGTPGTSSWEISIRCSS